MDLDTSLSPLTQSLRCNSREIRDLFVFAPSEIILISTFPSLDPQNPKIWVLLLLDLSRSLTAFAPEIPSQFLPSQRRLPKITETTLMLS
jgi:hypothetical protein